MLGARVRYSMGWLIVVAALGWTLLFAIQPQTARSADARWLDWYAAGAWQDTAALSMITPGSSVNNLTRAAQLIIRDYSKHVGGPYSYLAVDGQFGLQTSNAVAWYQGQRQLVPTGTVSSSTWEKMRTDIQFYSYGSGYDVFTSYGYHYWRKNTSNGRFYFYLDGPGRWYWANYHLRGVIPSGSAASGDSQELMSYHIYNFETYTPVLPFGTYGSTLRTVNRRLYAENVGYDARWYASTSVYQEMYNPTYNIDLVHVHVQTTNGLETYTRFFAPSLAAGTSYWRWWFPLDTTDLSARTTGYGGLSGGVTQYYSSTVNRADVIYAPYWSPQWEGYVLTGF
ncbi:MAG: peptidoglycan-binding domain-containing protein [Thermoleophilia bacterium]